MDLTLTRITIRVSPEERRRGSDYPARLLGMFDHSTGLMQAYYKESWLKEFTLDAFLDDLATYVSDAPTHAQRLTRALEKTALMHEWRHFHDCFMTPIGYRYYSDYVLAYATAAAVLAEGTRRFPVGSMKDVRAAINETPLRILADVTDGLLLDLVRSNGSEPLTHLPGHDFETDFYIAQVVPVGHTEGSEGGYEIPCVHANYVRQGEPYRVIWPLGFCLITEALATLEQELLMNCVDGQLAQEYFDQLKLSFNPYFPLLAAFTRLFRKHGLANMPLDVVYDCLGRSLFTQTERQEVHPGSRVPVGAIGEHILGILRDHLDIVGGEVSWRPPPVDREWWRQWNERSGQLSAETLPGALLNHVRDTYLTPALNLPDALDRVGYCTPAGYTYAIASLPPPPFILPNRHTVFMNDSHYHRLWSEWMLTRDIVQSAWWDNGDDFVCPVRHPDTQELFPSNHPLPSGDLCREGLRKQDCGVWRVDESYEGRECAWTLLMSQMCGPLWRRKE